ncbi:MAG: hypothetical protein ACYTBJ_17720 [Planctomycetota bacterium]|jgi:hypothetical protein
MIETGREVVCIKTHELSNGDTMFSDMVGCVTFNDGENVNVEVVLCGKCVLVVYSIGGFVDKWELVP